ncbi:Sulfate transporter/antisigma-factor antagonist STAS [Desulfovibrio sp. X2]|uniref:STAS domain-containing protein n=1 Tax=Desulfovibrio sp. X2 TaxID=941449 RepID=UPI0003588819|nr:STAS domain-containing protein [Desulfovibrio sp. X2]EPR44116.1 Sulfate transporter/antisigma-factor antagonist STAS [Desulfovibrio sp. X2]
MAEIRMTDGAGNCLLALGGDVTVQDVSEIRETLHGALLENSSIGLDISGVRAVDITFFQLFESLFKTAASLGKDVTLTGSVPPGVREAALECGIPGAGGNLERWLLV